MKIQLNDRSVMVTKTKSGNVYLFGGKPILRTAENYMFVDLQTGDILHFESESIVKFTLVDAVVTILS